MNSHSMIIWDMDGVIADTGSIKIRSIQSTLDSYGFRLLHTNDEILRTARASEIFLQYTESIDGLMSLYLHRYTCSLTKIKPFLSLSFLQSINRNKVAVLCTSQPLKKAKSTFVAMYGLDPEFLFDRVISEEDLSGMPKSSIAGCEVLMEVLKAHRIHRKSACYVGDSPDDILCARRIGVKSIAVSWGYYSLEDLSEVSPDGIVQSVPQLAELVFGNLFQ